MSESNQNHSRCPHTKTYIAEKIESYPVKNEEGITIKAKVRVCSLCGEELFDIKLDSDNIRQAFSIYRDRKNLISPDEIRSIRESLNLSQEELDTLTHSPLGSTKRYERGVIQPIEYDSKLKLLSSHEYGKLFHDAIVQARDCKDRKSILINLVKLSQKIQEFSERNLNT